MNTSSFSMNSGNDSHSYAKNSTLQKRTIDAVKDLIDEEIPEKLDAENLSSPCIIRLVDMGCSTGPNTFIAVQNIIEAIHKKYQLQGINSELPEFQVFFNDHVSNDFNTLFTSLPPNRQYHVAAVPGSFYDSLFPNASLNIVHSSFALNWLSRVPERVVNKTSPAENNRGTIFYSDNETAKAFADRFAEDMDCFLHFRAKEVVPGGLMIIVILGRSNGTPHSQVPHNIAFNLLGSCLVDMARKGVISEELVESFNIPAYLCSPKEVESAVARNGYFNIERLECVADDITDNHLREWSSHSRAVLEVLLKGHFGGEIMDALFDSFTEKLQNSVAFQYGKLLTLFVVLKRKFV